MKKITNVMLVTGLYILQACNTNHSNDRVDEAIAANEKKILRQ
jgi:hypothetical protein